MTLTSVAGSQALGGVHAGQWVLLPSADPSRRIGVNHGVGAAEVGLAEERPGCEDSVGTVQVFMLSGLPLRRSAPLLSQRVLFAGRPPSDAGYEPSWEAPVSRGTYD